MCPGCHWDGPAAEGPAVGTAGLDSILAGLKMARDESHGFLARDWTPQDIWELVCWRIYHPTFPGPLYAAYKEERA